MLKNKLIMGGLLAVCVLLGACSKVETEKPLLSGQLMESEQTNYNTETVQISNWTVEQVNSAAIILPRTTTFVWENGEASFVDAFVSRGDIVKKGDVLMQFVVEEDYVAMQELQLQLKRTTEAYKSDKEVKEIEIANAKKATEGLTSYALTIAQKKLEKLQAAYEQFVFNSERTIRDIQERINEVQERAADNTFVAPHDGIVESIAYMVSGDEVEIGVPLLTLYDINYLYLRTADAGYKLRYGMDVAIDIAYGRTQLTLPGRVISTPNMLPFEVDPGYAMLEIDLSSLTEEEYWAAMDMYTKFSIQYSCTTIELQDLMLISDDAVKVDEEKKAYVNVLENGIIGKRYISIGAEFGSQVWVIDGLSEGQTLIID